MFVLASMNRHDGGMELQQLRYVVAIAEEGTFTRAAQRCFVVQSALSHQVKALERELGVSLFARSSRRVELTPSGEAFLPHARASLAAAEGAIAHAAAAAGQVRGALSVGVIPTVTAVDVLELMAAYHHEHPAVDVTVRTGGSDQFVRALREGGLDVAFLGLSEGVEPQGVQHRELARERLVAVLPRDHALAGRRQVRLVDLVDEAFIEFPAASPGRDQGDRAFAAVGLVRRVAFEASDTRFMLDLVRHGLGVCLLPPGVVGSGAGVQTVDVEDGPVRAQFLAWRSFNPSPAALAFVEAVRARR